MKLHELVTTEEVIEQRRREDPEFAAEWDRLAVAREVAVEIMRYRAERSLTQRQLGAQVGMKQPQIARLEAGDIEPSIGSLRRLSAATGMEFNINVSKGGAHLVAA
jgi:ribosome-binding protein aMBF1 (putative translation factor)